MIADRHYRPPHSQPYVSGDLIDPALNSRINEDLWGSDLPPTLLTHALVVLGIDDLTLMRAARAMSVRFRAIEEADLWPDWATYPVRLDAVVLSQLVEWYVGLGMRSLSAPEVLVIGTFKALLVEFFEARVARQYPIELYERMHAPNWTEPLREACQEYVERLWTVGTMTGLTNPDMDRREVRHLIGIMADQFTVACFSGTSTLQIDILEMWNVAERLARFMQPGARRTPESTAR